MNYEKIIEINRGITGVTGTFFAQGSFGIIDGRDIELAKQKKVDDGYFADYDSFSVSCKIENLGNGVCFRQDTLTAKEDITLNGYLSRFLLEGGEYEVYTQYSNWQHESSGGFSPLVTSIEADNTGVRTTESATPMAVIRNKGNGKMKVFHLLPNAQWKIKVTRRPLFAEKFDAVCVELGINDKYLNLKIKKGETIEMPGIFFYNADNTLDFDAWKLHAAYNKMYPRKDLPVVYNTWMANFDTIVFDDILKQVDSAAEIGVEMFLIDAGWFGENEHWDRSIGDWRENFAGGYKGKVREISEYVRSKNMKFGMWIEPERALDSVPAAKEHPEYFIRGNGENLFLDFARDDARTYIFDVLCRMIEDYHLSFMKFDFNASLAYDESGNGFYRYFQGQRKLVRDLREKYPDLYITNCASGGNRMDLGQQTVFDSIWLSDNQGPISGLRIFKDTALRLPPSNIEKWDVRKYMSGFTKYGSAEPATLPVSCDGATWDLAVVVKPSFTHGYISGGVMGFSADIASYPQEEKAALMELIKKHKEDREFYKSAVMRILHDDDNITVLQYSDTEMRRVVIYVFCEYAYQQTLTVYPILNTGLDYGDDSLKDEGFEVELHDNDCVIKEFTGR